MVEDVVELSPLFFDTTYIPECGTDSWETFYGLFEREIQKEATIDDMKFSDASYSEFSCSVLHRITTRSQIITLC